MQKKATDYAMPLAEFLKLQETIRSFHGGNIPLHHQLPRVILSYAWCGLEFVRPAYVVAKNIRKGMKDFYCCKEHSCAHHAVKNSKTCPGCGRIIKHTGRTKGAKTCPECAAKFKKPSQVPVEHQPREKICPICNKLFMSAHRGRGIFAKYCSKRCSEIAHSILMSGKGNPRYRHGMTPLREQVHSARAFRQFRPLILDRDQHRCVLCGKEETRLEVHHMDLIPINNVATNLITLCSKCHRILHGMKEEQYKRDILPTLREYTEQHAVLLISK